MLSWSPFPSKFLLKWGYSTSSLLGRWFQERDWGIENREMKEAKRDALTSRLPQGAGSCCISPNSLPYWLQQALTSLHFLAILLDSPQPLAERSSPCTRMLKAYARVLRAAGMARPWQGLQQSLQAPLKGLRHKQGRGKKGGRKPWLFNEGSKERGCWSGSTTA